LASYPQQLIRGEMSSTVIQRIFGRCFGFTEEEQLLDNVRKGSVMDTHPAVVKNSHLFI